MIERRLKASDVLQGYEAVARLYPWIPPMIIWRGWEYAAYRTYTLREPVLDVGCGDGRFFRLVFPALSEVHGVDADAGVADAALRSGVYREVHVRPAHALPLEGRRFRSAFANCSLEHMDRLPDVLRGIFQSLEPGGSFVFSVVTNRVCEPSPLRVLLRAIGDPERGAGVQRQHETYHHLANALSVEQWRDRLQEAGFHVLEHTPVVTDPTGGLFLMADQLWHVPSPTGELGDDLYRYVRGIPRFNEGFRTVLSGLLEMSGNGDGFGAVFHARRAA